MSIKELESNEKVLACITTQAGSKRLIDNAAEVSKELDAELHILHVNSGSSVLGNGSAELLSELFELGRDAGGNTHGLLGDDIPKTILNFIKDNHITHVVVGMPKKISPFASVGLVDMVREQLPHVDMTLVPPETEPTESNKENEENHDR